MILTDIEIRKRVIEQDLIIGFNEDNLQSASYDLTITNKIRRFMNDFKRIDLSNKELIESYYEEIDITYSYNFRPGEFILVQLNEIVNMPNDLTAHIRPRTTFIRLGIYLSSQHINPTYKGRLSLGLHNFSPYVIELLPNLIIGQIIFEQLSEIPSEEKLYKNKPDSKYQNETDFVNSKVYQEVELKNKFNKLIDDLKKR